MIIVQLPFCCDPQLVFKVKANTLLDKVSIWSNKDQEEFNINDLKDSFTKIKVRITHKMKKGHSGPLFLLILSFIPSFFSFFSCLACPFFYFFLSFL